MSESCSLRAAMGPTSEDGRMKVLLSVIPPSVGPEGRRLAGDICLVIDVSGSMQMEATIKSGTGREAGAPPLSVLDIVKHGVKTLVHTMNGDDRLSIVSYSDAAKIVLPLLAMDEDGKAIAVEAIDSLYADGQTNLWDGLHTGLNLLRTDARNAASSAVLVLTDGVPNVEPPGGHVTALATYIANQGGKLPCTVHSFGFGTDLDSRLLNRLAELGDGMYTFIPDASFVGTALVNCTANSLVTMGRNAKITLECLPGSKLADSHGYAINEQTSSLHLGSLQFGQTKDAVVNVTLAANHTSPSAPFLNATLCYDGPNGPVQSSAAMVTSCDADADVEVQQLRLEFVDMIAKVVETVTPDGVNVLDAHPFIDEFSFRVSKSSQAADSRISALSEDLAGQVREATSQVDWYKNWGMHYLQSLARAHLTQQCNNFKDPGVQVYGGDLFNDVRDVADDIFVNLPPPSVADRSKLDMLRALGFPEEECQRALTVALDDAELAATYLMEGIPSSPQLVGAHRPVAHAPAPVAYDMHDYYDRYGG